MTREEQRTALLVHRIKDNCYEVSENLLKEHDKQIRAEVIDEHFAKIMSFINTSNRGNSDYFIVDQIENYIAEHLKENK